MDDTNISRLPGAVIPIQRQADPDLVGIAERILDRVRSGETTALACVEIRYDQLGIMTCWLGPNTTLLLGAVSCLAHDLNVET